VLTTSTSLPVASALPSALPLEQIIGEVTADAAVVLARALREFQTDELSTGSRTQWGDRTAQLFELWIELMKSEGARVASSARACSRPATPYAGCRCGRASLTPPSAFPSAPIWPPGPFVAVPRRALVRYFGVDLPMPCPARFSGQAASLKGP